MNYKNKKYLSEDIWLTQKLNKLDFFLLAQLKSCDSKEWIDIQKKLQKIDLKIKFVSFKNFKSTQFFSAFKNKTLFKGKLILIYSKTEVKQLVSLMDFIRITKVLRPLITYSNGRFININFDIFIKEIEIFDLLQWNSLLNQFSGSNILNIFDVFRNYHLELLQFQYKVLLDILIHESQNENKV